MLWICENLDCTVHTLTEIHEIPTINSNWSFTMVVKKNEFFHTDQSKLIFFLKDNYYKNQSEFPVAPTGWCKGDTPQTSH